MKATISQKRKRVEELTKKLNAAQVVDDDKVRCIKAVGK